MKIDIKDIFDLLTKIQNEQGNFKVFIVIILIITIGLLIIYLKYFTKSIVETTAKKSIAEFENNLNEKLHTQLGLFFRDDNVRNDLLSYIGKKAIDKKIECWQTIQSMYFKYQKSWTFSDETKIEEYVELDNELTEIRKIIFVETIYLGYYLSQRMVHLNSLMRNNIRLKQTEFRFSGNNYQPHLDSKLQSTIDKQSINETEINNILSEIEEWIIKNLHSDKTIENFEFNKEQLEIIKKEKDMKFDNFKS